METVYPAVCHYGWYIGGQGKKWKTLGQLYQVLMLCLQKYDLTKKLLWLCTYQ